MGRFVKGDVVVVPFPFSDLTDTKRRPALVVATLTGDDVILCQITSQKHSDSYSVLLQPSELPSGCLEHTSYIRPNRLFTADSNIILRQAGRVTQSKMQDVIARLVSILHSP